MKIKKLSTLSYSDIIKYCGSEVNYIDAILERLLAVKDIEGVEYVDMYFIN